MEKKVCDILIGNYKYDLVERPKHVHELGKRNNTQDNLWVKYVCALFGEIKYIPWIDKGNNRKSWHINIKQCNKLNHGDNDSLNGKTNISIALNNTKIYGFMCNDLNYAFSNSQYIICELESLPIDILNMSSIIGRDIYYKGQPAKIKHYDSHGDLTIVPDCSDDYIDKWWSSIIYPWVSNYEYYEDCIDDNEIKIDLLSKEIFWWRDDRADKINIIKRKIGK